MGACRSTHFDVYRLGDVDEMDEIGYETISTARASA